MIEHVPVKILLEHPMARIPKYAHDDDAGADVFVVSNSDNVCEQFSDVLFAVDDKRRSVRVEKGDWLIPPRGTSKLSLGFRIELQPGWEMQVRSRSGMSYRGIIVANAPGTIDSGWRGINMVILQNTTNTWRVIKPLQRIAQFVLKRAPRAEFVEVDKLSETERNEGGFGSTGS